MSGIALFLIYFAMVLKTYATFSINQIQSKRESRLGHPRFLALQTVSLMPLWILIRSLWNCTLFLSAFLLSVVHSKPKESQRPTRRKKNNFKSQWELKVKRTKLPEAREDADDQVVIGFSFASDWPRMWREFSAPSTEQSKAIPMQCRITFDALLLNCSSSTIRCAEHLYNL